MNAKLVGIVGVVAEKEQHWNRSGDELVFKRLTAELARIRSAGSPAEILGSETPKEQRKAFLSATKSYHPSRFARRPTDIRQLSNEVYLSLKEAYELAKNADATSLPKPSSAVRTPRPAISDSSGSIPKIESKQSAEARAELAQRRRERLKKRLSTSSDTDSRSTPRRGAQIRAQTAPLQSSSDSLTQENTEFNVALLIMKSDKFSEAAVLFKKLAVARPSEKRFRMHMHYCQGRYYQQSNQEEQARSEFKRALGLDAGFVLAQRALSALPSESGAKKKGLFSRIFGK